MNTPVQILKTKSQRQSLLAGKPSGLTNQLARLAAMVLIGSLWVAKSWGQDEDIAWLDSLIEDQPNHGVWIGQSKTDWNVSDDVLGADDSSPINPYLGAQFSLTDEFLIGLDLSGFETSKNGASFEESQSAQQFGINATWLVGDWSHSIGFGIGDNEFEAREVFFEADPDNARARNVLGIVSEGKYDDQSFYLSSAYGFQFDQFAISLDVSVQRLNAGSEQLNYQTERQQRQRLNGNWETLVSDDYLYREDLSQTNWLSSASLSINYITSLFNEIDGYIQTGVSGYQSLRYFEQGDGEVAEQQSLSPLAVRIVNQQLQNDQALTDTQRQSAERIFSHFNLGRDFRNSQRTTIRNNSGATRGSRADLPYYVSRSPDEKNGGNWWFSIGTEWQNIGFSYTRSSNFAESTTYRSDSIELSYRF